MEVAAPTSLPELEREVAEGIARREDELVALATDLVGFDTTARNDANEPPREEEALQRYLAARLAAAGADVGLWEPAPEDVGGSKLAPRDGIGFAGRPQLAARFPGGGRGRSLLLNGHVDVVAAEPAGRWSSEPFRAEVRDGRLHGRGTSDMKGGIAALVFAAEALARAGAPPAGDLVVCG